MSNSPRVPAFITTIDAAIRPLLSHSRPAPEIVKNLRVSTVYEVDGLHSRVPFSVLNRNSRNFEILVDAAHLVDKAKQYAVKMPFRKIAAVIKGYPVCTDATVKTRDA